MCLAPDIVEAEGQDEGGGEGRGAGETRVVGGGDARGVDAVQCAREYTIEVATYKESSGGLGKEGREGGGEEGSPVRLLGGSVEGEEGDGVGGDGEVEAEDAVVMGGGSGRLEDSS
jgi:hypothetical protein